MYERAWSLILQHIAFLYFDELTLQEASYDNETESF